MESMVDDKREIKSIWLVPNGDLTVGTDGVTRIESYREGLGTISQLWFAVWRGDSLVSRVNAAQVMGMIYNVDGAVIKA